jgi:GH15 family glucan-1,4-alpha-glucosidase
VRRLDGARLAVAGPDALCLRTPVECRGESFHTVADFSVRAGDRVPFVLTWFPSHEELPDPLDAERELRETEGFWRAFGGRCGVTGRYEEPVRSSLRVLKALTYLPTGGLVAAPTTSLPEQPGGVRNWDYRFCWLRDATFALLCMMEAGYESEARSWRDWLLRAVAGDPGDLQAVYGLSGERRLGEDELSWLPGYEGARPVRVGNRACSQLQLDTYGELLDALYEAREVGIAEDPTAWALQRKLLDHLERGWREPDEGIWEVRGPRRHFTHSKVLSWVAFDRAARSVERHGLEGPVDRWRALRDELHADICRQAWNPDLGAFAQSYGSDRLDAAVLLMPLVGFLPPTDERVVGTVRAIEERLLWDGLVRRYDADDDEVDGLPPGEGVFLPCSFWLADNLALQGRRDEAEALYGRLLGLRNDVGLLAEEYHPDTGRQLGNFPQAFSHVAVVNTAFNLDGGEGRAHSQARRGGG